MNNAKILRLRCHPCLPALISSVSPEALTVGGEGRVDWSEKALSRLDCHIEMIKKWNSSIGLVSPHDIPYLVDRHVLDALSLMPFVARAAARQNRVLDIGSGAGFPSIPIKVMFPELDLTLIERDARKATFLTWVITALGMEGIRVLEGQFPDVAPDEAPCCVTARAVEKPEKILRSLRKYLSTETLYICQFRNPERVLGSMFHVEHVEDEWTRQGWRRGDLSLVRRTT